VSDYQGTVLHSGIKGMQVVGETDEWVEIRVGDGSGSVLEFMSTHPTDANRIAKMKEVLPEAMKYYNKQ
jgi:Zn-dependent protease with chaperone function